MQQADSQNAKCVCTRRHAAVLPSIADSSQNAAPSAGLTKRLNWPHAPPKPAISTCRAETCTTGREANTKAPQSSCGLARLVAAKHSNVSMQMVSADGQVEL